MTLSVYQLRRPSDQCPKPNTARKIGDTGPDESRDEAFNVSPVPAPCEPRPGIIVSSPMRRTAFDVAPMCLTQHRLIHGGKNQGNPSVSFDVALFTLRPDRATQKRGKTKETRSVSEGFFAF